MESSNHKNRSFDLETLIKSTVTVGKRALRRREQHVQRPSGVKCGWSRGQRGRQARPAGPGVRGRAGATFRGSQVSSEVSAADGHRPVCIFVFPDVLVHIVVKKDQIILRTF